MTKFSDNASEGNYPQDNKKKLDKYKTTKNGPLISNGSGALGELKIENSKNQTFNSDLEDSASAHGLIGS